MPSYEISASVSKSEKPRPSPPPVAGGGTTDGQLRDPEQPWAPGGAGSASNLGAQAEMDRQADHRPGAAPALNDSAGDLGASGARLDALPESTAQADMSTGEAQGMNVEQQNPETQIVSDSSAEVLVTPDPWVEDPGFDSDWVGKS
jgi:hypothetical protein